MRFLGLDLGERRIGVALSDPEGVLARPLEVIRRRSRQEDFAAIARLVAEWAAERIVIGLPCSSAGELGVQARRVKRYARDLERALAVPVVFVDESFTTVDALARLREAGRSVKKQRELVDAVAAALILQSYLDSQPRPGFTADR